MATAIYFGGRRLNIPQAVSLVDASALAAISPAAVGTVALVGIAEGGEPLTVEESKSDATRPDTIQTRYRSGELRTAALFAFEPSTDPGVPAGAQKVIAVKVNPATGSGVSLPDDNNNDALDLTSKDFGQFTAQVNILVSAGTLSGNKYTVVFEDNVETFDNVGGDALFDVEYTPSTEGYGTALARNTETQFLVAATKAKLGLDTQRTNDIPATGVVQVASSNAADTTQSVTVYGLDALNVAVRETLALNGTTVVTGTQAFAKVVAVVMSATALGTVTVSDSPVTVSLFVLTAGQTTRGAVITTNTPAAGVATLSIDVNAAVDAVVVGTNAAGAVVMERFDLTTAFTTPVVGVVAFKSITAILLGDVAVARTVTTSINAIATAHTTISTVQKLADFINTLAGFVANAYVSNATTYLVANADYNVAPARPPASVLSAVGSFYGDLFAAIELLTAQSQYVNAARATGPAGALPPKFLAAPVYLVGGTEGVTTLTEWAAAFKLLQRRRYNIIVPLSRDPAVHALASIHLQAKAGRLRSEANGYIGIATAAGAGETRTNIQAQIQAINTRYVSAISQEVERFDPVSGIATFYPPYIYAAIAAGMQAGTPIAEPLTRKTMISTNIRNDSSWTVEDDGSDLIDRGLMMAEKVDGIGIRWVRSVTTHLADDNLAFVEMSSMESLNTFLYEFRTELEQEVGQRGLPRTAGAIKGRALAKASLMVDQEKIFDFKNIQVSQTGDVFPVSIEVALVNPVNFIPITVHLKPSTATAA